MKWRWHRSLVFWAGLLVMGFISWAWVDSWWTVSGLSNGNLTVASTESGVFFGSNARRANKSWDAVREHRPPLFPPLKLSLPFILSGTGVDSMHHEKFVKRSAPDLRTHFEEVMRFRRANSIMIYMPYWLVMVAASMLWLPLLAWRWRKVKCASPDAA